MNVFHGFWGGMLVGIAVIALCTRVEVPLATTVANTVANRKA